MSRIEMWKQKRSELNKADVELSNELIKFGELKDGNSGNLASFDLVGQKFTIFGDDKQVVDLPLAKFEKLVNWGRTLIE